MARVSWALAAVLVVAALAGCGGSLPSGYNGSDALHGNSNTATATVTGANGGSLHGYAARKPAQILADAVAAMHAAHSYRAAGVISEEGTPVSATISVQAPASIDAAITTGAQHVRTILIPGSSYIWANLSFWQAHGSNLPAGAAQELAGRWLKTPQSEAAQLTKALHYVAPKLLSQCLAEQFVKPTVSGNAKVAGQNAVLLKTVGGTPGSAPADLYVAAAAPHYPLLFRQTGPTLPGGKKACSQSATSGPGRSRLAFTRWNAVTIAAPADAETVP